MGLGETEGKRLLEPLEVTRYQNEANVVVFVHGTARDRARPTGIELILIVTELEHRHGSFY